MKTYTFTNTYTIKNLTPHEVVMCDEAGKEVAKYPSMGVARAEFKDVPAGEVCGFPVVRKEFGPTVDLPEPTEGTYYLVSLTTAQAAKAEGRTTDDLLMTANLVRDDAGRVVGCKAFSRL